MSDSKLSTEVNREDDESVLTAVFLPPQILQALRSSQLAED